MQPEQLARRSIDEQLSECGWTIQDSAAINIAAGQRSAPLKANAQHERLDDARLKPKVGHSNRVDVPLIASVQCEDKS